MSAAPYRAPRTFGDILQVKHIGFGLCSFCKKDGDVLKYSTRHYVCPPCAQARADQLLPSVKRAEAFDRKLAAINREFDTQPPDRRPEALKRDAPRDCITPADEGIAAARADAARMRRSFYIMEQIAGDECLIATAPSFRWAIVSALLTLAAGEACSAAGCKPPAPGRELSIAEAGGAILALISRERGLVMVPR